MLNSIKDGIRWFIYALKYRRAKVYFGSTLSANCSLSQYSVVFSGVTLIDVAVDTGTYVQTASTILHSDIGKYCSIASNVSIGLIDHPMTYLSTNPMFYDASQPLPRFYTSSLRSKKPTRTTIGSDVWIADSAFIKSGVIVGHGAIVAAGSIVVNDVEPYSIVGGNPARHLRYRFDKSLIEKLLQSQWWELDSDVLERYSEYFQDPDEFIKQIKRV